MRNFQRSTSVCMIMRLKFVFGSMSPVMVSTSSICFLIRFVARSMRPSVGHLESQLCEGEVGTTYGRSSVVPRSLTQARVNAWRSACPDFRPLPKSSSSSANGLLSFLGPKPRSMSEMSMVRGDSSVR